MYFYKHMANNIEGKFENIDWGLKKLKNMLYVGVNEAFHLILSSG